MLIIEPIIGTYERGDINEHIARLIRDLGNPEPPLRLEQVRELLKLDRICSPPIQLLEPSQ